MSGIIGSYFNTRGSGVVAKLGTDGQVFTSTGAGLSQGFEAAAGGGDFVKLAAETASDDAIISFDGDFTSDYKTYVFEINSFVPVTSNQPLLVRYRRGDADVTTTNYDHTGVQVYEANNGTGNDTDDGGWSQSAINTVTGSQISADTVDGGISGRLTLYDPLDTAHYKKCIHQEAYTYTSIVTRFYEVHGSGQLHDATTALSGVSFYFTSGNVQSGTITLYGITI